MNTLQMAAKAFHEDDAAGLGKLFNLHPELKTMVSQPMGDFGMAPVTCVRSAAMLDVLLDAGADINAVSKWWAGGFRLLDLAEPELAAYAIKRGAVVTAHSAARLGLLDELKTLVGNNPKLVHERGGDGQTPLHFASTVEIADYLLSQGAEIDVRDVDHQSTPAQYMVRSRPMVARFLVERGCQTDILMAAALGDERLVLQHLEKDPESIRTRVNDKYFPMTGKAGGTIYQWELGWHVSACQVARSFGHTSLSDLLLARCPTDEKLLNACWLHDEKLVQTLLEENPKIADSVSVEGQRQFAHAARNNDAIAAGLMLRAGLPITARGQHNATPLHWAAWHGIAELVRAILPLGPALEDKNNDFQSTVLGWAIHGSENGWQKHKGDYVGTVAALLDAGAVKPGVVGGSEAVRAVLLGRA
jgi:ankyrin repeat protein